MTAHIKPAPCVADPPAPSTVQGLSPPQRRELEHALQHFLHNTHDCIVASLGVALLRTSRPITDEQIATALSDTVKPLHEAVVSMLMRTPP
jgi:hypothetical protein